MTKANDPIDYRSYDAYESEGSVPPRNRGAMVRRNDNTNTVAYPAAANGMADRNGPATNGTKSENNGDDDSDDESSVMSSSEDEHQEEKKKRDKLITGGIATIATLNAAANVYNSMKMREARSKQLADGQITKDEAKRQRYKHHLQDAAAIGVSAICVKGAYAKWQQTTEKHREHRDHKKERQERSEKRLRLEAQRRMRSGSEENALSYANGDSVQHQRPAYHRAYSRSLDDVRPDYNPQYPQYPQYSPYQQQYPKYQRDYGRRRHHQQQGYGDYQGYDADPGIAGDGGE
jgi:hypothetical protein